MDERLFLFPISYFIFKFYFIFTNYTLNTFVKMIRNIFEMKSLFYTFTLMIIIKTGNGWREQKEEKDYIPHLSKTIERITIEQNYKKYLTERIQNIKKLSKEVDDLSQELSFLLDENSNLEKEHLEICRNIVAFRKTLTN
ncbi:hypothetical protein BpHYR1_013377 [Brachionus plicatilis]|uniref:Uncharacterized protein n=1 Tax=Brachionus plicatilis TaxID=10195 RepID=A0A3M7SM07_BRAPC|nr:hypothetical protein BpHYR1_013377 [Brachionus plicatilis]